MASGELVQAIEQLTNRINELEHQAELLKTVLIVKEPGAIISATAFEGLRKQIIASANDRLAHLNQIVQMRVALDRGGSVDDLKTMVASWEAQSGIIELHEPRSAEPISDLFDAVDGGSLEGGYSVVEPAFIDSQSGRLLRTGRAVQLAEPAEDGSAGTDADSVDPTPDQAPTISGDSSPHEGK